MLTPSAQPGSHCLLNCNLWIHVVRIVWWKESVSCLKFYRPHPFPSLGLTEINRVYSGILRVSLQAFLQCEAEL